MRSCGLQSGCVSRRRRRRTAQAATDHSSSSTTLNLVFAGAVWLISGSLLFFCSCVVAAECKAGAAAAATVRPDLALETGFYQTSCPELQDIVSYVVASHVRKDPTSGAPLVRLFFHDCAVNVSKQISLSRRPLNIQILFCSCHSQYSLISDQLGSLSIRLL